MLGSLRFTLALLVLLNHLWKPVANQVGASAVIAFYTVSGFLMTKVITEVYGASWRGGVAFTINRLLRIYPCYLLVVALSTSCLFLFDDRFGHFYSSMKLPATEWQWFSNLTLIDMVDQPRVIVPPAWSLSVELLFYGLMIVLLARSRPLIRLWFALSLLFTAKLIWTGADFAERYYPPWSASLWFSIGALLYVEPWFRKAVVVNERSAWLLLLAFCLFPLGVRAAGFDPHWLGFYGAYVLFLPLLATALETPSMVMPKLDRRLGDLAYPVFVGHFMIGGMAYVVAGSWIRPYGTVFTILIIALTVAFALAYVSLIDDRIQAWRAAIRPKPLVAR